MFTAFYLTIQFKFSLVFTEPIQKGKHIQASMAPKKKAKLADQQDDALQFAQRAQWMSENRKANAVNAKVLNDMLFPALTYLKNLAIFQDWDLPQPLQLKTKDEKENGQLGAFMAPFEKRSCVQSLQNSGKYIAAVPLPHIDFS